MNGQLTVVPRVLAGVVVFAGALLVHAGSVPVFHNGTGGPHGAGARGAALTWTMGAVARAEIGSGCAQGGLCGPGEVCRVGLCMEACEVEATCLEGMHCLGGACVPDAVACLETAHCASQGEGRVCHEGMCLLPQCTTDAGCAPGWVCAGQVCEDPNAPDVVPGTDVVSLKARLRERYLGCDASGGAAGPLAAALGLLFVLWAGRRRSGPKSTR